MFIWDEDRWLIEAMGEEVKRKLNAISPTPNMPPLGDAAIANWSMLDSTKGPENTMINDFCH